METFSWKLKGLARGVTPDVAAEELRRLQNLHGAVTPELIVKESTEESSPLHPIFEWDNNKAAYNYRLQQARNLLNNIQVTVISDGESKQISVYEVTTASEGYKSIDTFTPSDIQFVKMSVMRDLTILKDKLTLYKEFDKVRYHVEQAIEAV